MCRCEPSSRCTASTPPRVPATPRARRRCAAWSMERWPA